MHGPWIAHHAAIMVTFAAAQAGGDSKEGWEDWVDPAGDGEDTRPPVHQRPPRPGGSGGVRSLADGLVFVINPDPPPRTLQEMDNVRTQEVMLPGGGRISLSAGGGSGIMMARSGAEVQAHGPYLARARAPAARVWMGIGPFPICSAPSEHASLAPVEVGI